MRFAVRWRGDPLGPVRLGLPGGYEIRGTGTVRWLREPRDGRGETKPGMGIEFDDVENNGRALIAEFVEMRAPDFHVG